ncbi:MAG: TetR/AcrR family transcriptional regulator [Clostridia bacterium]|nr:TetR/AcrR family transcriptional regulator [Clostridia bacterium]
MREQVVKDIKEEFLGASFRYLVSHGLENTSIRDLCKNIGISSGSLYYWFENKDDVYINAARYGLTKVAESLLGYACDNIANTESFFDDALLEEFVKYRDELRLIYQVATSPVYGERMRKKAMELNESYSTYACKLGDILGCTSEIMAPVIYLFISILLDYIVWGDYDTTKLQIRYLYEDLMIRIKNPNIVEELNA